MNGKHKKSRFNYNLILLAVSWTIKLILFDTVCLFSYQWLKMKLIGRDWITLPRTNNTLDVVYFDGEKRKIGEEGNRQEGWIQRVWQWMRENEWIDSGHPHLVGGVRGGETEQTRRDTAWESPIAVRLVCVLFICTYGASPPSAKKPLVLSPVIIPRHTSPIGFRLPSLLILS